MGKRLYLALLVTATLTACDKTPPAPAPTPVEVTRAAVMEGVEALAYSAEIQPESTVDLAFRVQGYIREIALRPGSDGKERVLQTGDTVQPGDMLAQVEDQEYQDKLQEAQANLDRALAAERKADQDFKRASALKKSQSITGPDYDSAEKEYLTATASVAATTAQLDQARIKLEDTRLESPIMATVLQRKIEVGTLVHSNTVAFVLGKIETVKAVFGLQDTLLDKVTPGMSLAVHSASYPGRNFPGVLTEIAAEADTRTHLFNVSVSVPNSDGALRPGMIVALQLDDDTPAVEPIGIPLDAVTSRPDGSFAVFVVEEQNGDTVARLTPVGTGRVIGNQVIATGLKEGQSIVIKGASQLSDGQTVRVVR